MQQLHLPTLIIVSLVNGLVLLLVMLHTRLTRKSCPGFNHWVLGSFCWFFGTLMMFGLRGLVPDWLAVVVANTLLFVHPVLFLAGQCIFYDIPPRWWRTPLNWVLTGSLALIFIYSTLYDPQLPFRVVVGSVLLGFLYLRVALEPLFFSYQARRHSVQWILSLTLMPLCLLLFYRAFLYVPVLGAPVDFSYMMQQDTVLVGMTVYVNFCIAIMFYSCISLNSNRLEMQLLATQLEAERANSAKSLFLSQMSHEMRTPLTAMTSGVEILGREQHSERGEETLALMRRSIDHLVGHVDGLLDLTRVETGTIRISGSWFSLQSLADEIEAFYQVRMEQHQLSFRVLVDQSLPDLLHGDRQRIFQILANLLNNAIKSTPQGDIILKVVGEGSSNKVRFAVIDRGIGIAPEKQEAIFEPFISGFSQGGTGIGLAIARGLAKAMGGELECQSRPGEGSTFSLLLPLIDTEEVSTAGVSRQSQSEGVIANQIRILAVDDLPDNLRLLSLLLEPTPVVVVPAGSIAEALRVLEECHFDLVLTDIRLGLESGLELIRSLRLREQSAATGHLPIIAISADAYQETRQAALAAGADVYLSRPFTQNDLLSVIAQTVPTCSQLQISGSDQTGEGERSLEHLRSDCLKRIASMVEIIEEACRQKDVARIREEGHRLKGLGMAFGFPHIEDIGASLENLTRDDIANRVPELLRKLDLQSAP
jgi:signal transduction histidine kinase/DNA-binding NarL/FixJ family response regulator